MTIQELTEGKVKAKLPEPGWYAWYYVPQQGVMVRRYDPNKTGGEHESMAGHLGLNDIDEIPRGNFWISDPNKKQTSHISYNWAGDPPKNIHNLLRTHLKVPKEYAHYNNDTREWVIKPMDENWSPKNKAKHKSCQQRVKNRVSVWPSAYASAQVVQCYYGKKKRKKKS